MKALFILVCVISTCSSSLADSYYTTRLDDAQAVYLTADAFGVRGDGKADDAPALQAAIDAVAAKGHPGVLFIPKGRYRLGQTVYVWPGVRLFGYGGKRPVFVLGKDTPGFQQGDGRYMLYFSGGRGREPGDQPRDGNPGTFYSAMSNIDIEIEPGNPAAVAIRFHVAQHSYLSHMTFNLGDARAGLEDIGNEVEDLHFVGGQHGIITARSAPGWPIVVIDCTFEGQSQTAITCDEGGLAVIRPTIRNVPVAISFVPGKPDQLWVSDAQFENVTDAAVLISRDSNARTQVNLENIVCRDVPVLARFRESGKSINAPAEVYKVNHLSHGMHLNDTGTQREITTSFEAEPLDSMSPPVASDIAVPKPADTWVNVRTLGVTGDGETDDTEALQQAIDTQRTLYFPIGVYRVSDTLTLQPDTALIGLQPGSTAIYVANETPAFADKKTPRPVIESAPGGANIISGIGIYTGSINPGAVGIKWTAGADSLVNDVRLHGGHGTRLPGDIHDSRGRENSDQWDRQHPSLWVTDGGGGVFKDIWTPSPYASAGMLISDTSTPGRLYAMSAEHHVSHEVVLRNVSNWRFYALQFEAERVESPRDLQLLIEDSHDVLFANTFFYRVVSSFEPYPTAVDVNESSDIRFRNLHVYSNSKVSYDSAIRDTGTGLEVRDSEFAVLDVTGDVDDVKSVATNDVIAPGARVEKLADGFQNIAGATADSQGNLYFADPRALTVYKWTADKGELTTVRKIPQRPEQLAIDRLGNLLVVAYDGDGTVLAFDPDDPESQIKTLEAQPATTRPDGVAILPVNRWMGIADFMQSTTTPKPYHYLAPDGSTFIPAGEDFVTGETRWGTKLTDILRAFQLAPGIPDTPGIPGNRIYVTNEHELRTWSFTVGSDGTLSDPAVFVEQGGEGVAVDASGRVYLAAGQVRVFDAKGKPLGKINIPERPTSLTFGGTDGKTLYITARSALYAVRIP